MSKSKQTPKVVSYKKYKEETEYILTQLGEYKLKLEHQYEANNLVRADLIKEQDANCTVRAELSVAMKNVVKVEELMKEMSNDLYRIKAQNESYKQHIIALEEKLIELKKSQKKWYHFF